MKPYSFKRLPVCALLATLLLALTPCAVQAGGVYGMVKGGNLHLRASGSSSSASLGLYPSGTWVEVLSQGGAWCQVRTETDKTGYMATGYLTIDAGDTLATGVIRNPNGYVNLRSYASMNATVLGRYESGTAVEILARLSSGWSQVRVGGQTGYMVTDFVPSSQESRAGYITSRYGSRINLRSGPRADAEVITSLPTGARVDVLLSGRDWHKIAANGYTGYMSAQYISSTPGGGSSSPSNATVKNPRSTQVLNLRAQPSLESKVLGYYANGTQVRVVSRGETWTEVYVGALHGYMMTAYLEFDDSVLSVMSLYNPNGGSVVNMRSAASLYSPVIGVYPVGSRVTVHRRGTDWCYVTIGSQTGYVSTYFLR